MPNPRSRPAVPRRWAVSACLLAVLVATMTSAVTRGATSSVSSASQQSSAHESNLTSPVTTRAASPVRTATSATSAADPDAASHAVVHTMSMDAPIQGGLTAHQEQALSERLRAQHRDASVAGRSSYWTAAMGRSAVARAKSWLGMPYSWAGGNASGPTTGRCDTHNGGDLDCHVVGFDCSGLAMYAWGPYASLPHLAATQREAGAFHPSPDELRPGDLVFFAGYLSGGTGHVAIYAGHGMVIEAPQSGSVIRQSSLADLMAQDGAYRGAVRPLTAPAPTLISSGTDIPTTGGTITLRGANLSQVTAVHLGGVPVTQFSRHSDTTLVFSVPARRSGTVRVSVSTSWYARSGSVNVTFTDPPRSTPVGSSTAPPSTTAPPPLTLAPPTSSAPTPHPSSTSTSSGK